MEKLCARCEERPRRSARQSWCKECHSTYVRQQREEIARLVADRAAGDRSNFGPRSGVYFVQCGEFIKIGVSIDVTRRFNSIKNANPHAVKALGFIPEPIGGLADELEARLHEQFASLRHRAEWFRQAPTLDSFMAEHMKPWPVGYD